VKSPEQSKLHVRILSPTRTYLDAEAISVSGNNKVGRFDILADHANFFSLLTEGELVVDMGNSSTFKLPVSQGIVKVTNNVVTFFVDIEQAHAVEQHANPAESS